MHISKQNKSILWVILWTFLFTILMSIAKQLSSNINLYTIVFMRCFFALVLFLPLVHKNIPSLLKTKNLKLHILRSCMASCAMLCTYYAYTSLPLTMATSIGFTSPFIVVILATFLLKDKIQPKQIIAITIGYIGILIITKPSFADLSFCIIIAILANIFAALVIIITKLLTKTDSEKTILLYHTIFLSIIMGLISCFQWTTPNYNDSLLLLLMGFCASISQYSYIKALKFSTPSFLAPFEYTKLLFAMPVGYLYFSEQITMLAIVGGIIIILANYYFVSIKEPLPTK